MIVNTIRPEDRDLLADIIWFIRGAQSQSDGFALNADHIQALIHYRETDVQELITKATLASGNRVNALQADIAALEEHIKELRKQISKKERGPGRVIHQP